MSEIIVERLTQKELDEMKVKTWPIWEKEVSKFDWFYDEQEMCFFLQGQVEVSTKDGNKVSFGKGDFVTFPKGMACVWDIKQPVKKHYKFG